MTAPTHFTRFAAIDWSGARGEHHPGIAIALCEAGDTAPALVSPPSRAWSRADVRDWMLAQADTPTLIGLDLSPALPFVDKGSYFPEWPGSPADAPSLWKLIDELSGGDPHHAANIFLDHPEVARHFRVQGRPAGDLFSPRNGRLRRCEEAQQPMELAPSSCMKLIGANQVGKSSLTGMRVLHQLARRIPVWPFDPVPPAGPLIVEIYTSLAARDAGIPRGRSKMRDSGALDRALRKLGVDEPAKLDSYDDHATDAVLTAAWLRRNARRADLWHPHGIGDVAATEGWTFGVA
ncbi:hypothetical protein OF829_20230 [Sphingomonas sp. LB-2]|nr:hypothetical protein [Sphingomonas caeni]